MSNAPINLTINLPGNHDLEAIYPISCGPYMGHDVLLLVNNLRGSSYVIRATFDGKHLSTSDLVPRGEGEALVKKLILDQSNRNCSAVTCGGKYGCD